MIRSFRCKESEKVFKRQTTSHLPHSIKQTAYRKLVMLDSAEKLSDLRSPPGNRLEALSGNRKGQYSIRINEQWRICFVWKSDDSYQVEIIDYH